MSTQQQDSKFGVVIYDTDGDESCLDRAILSLHKVDYDKSKIAVSINSYPKRDIPYLMNKVEDLKSLGFKASVNININPAPKHVVDYNVVSKVLPCDYLVKIDHDAVCPQGVLTYVNSASGYSMFGASGVSIIPFNVVNGEYEKYKDYDAMSNSLKGICSDLGVYKEIE